jgi:hypothetical protein
MSDTQTHAVFDEIRDWFFEGYLPTWVAAGAGSETDPRSVLDYWGVPMHAANLVVGAIGIDGPPLASRKQDAGPTSVRQSGSRPTDCQGIRWRTASGRCDQGRDGRW